MNLLIRSINFQALHTPTDIVLEELKTDYPSLGNIRHSHDLTIERCSGEFNLATSMLNDTDICTYIFYPSTAKRYFLEKQSPICHHWSIDSDKYVTN